MSVKWIAEIGSNHNQDIFRCYNMIDIAEEMGCWAVKFQLFKANKLYSPEFKSKIEAMSKWELPDDFIVPLAQYCRNIGIKFICTPFDLESVELLKNKVDYFKIGSYELLNHNLIKAVSRTKRPWMLSVGMGILNEIKEAIKFEHPPIALLYCNSNYPANPKNCSLCQIPLLKVIFPEIPTGWSDHTVEPGVIYQAIALSAEIVEFHIDLEDGKGFEYPVGHCWLPSQIKEVIRNVRIGEEACSSVNFDKDNKIRKWRMDPEDGMRPLKKYRKELLENELA